MDCKLTRLEARLEEIALGQASRETENAKVSYEVRNLKAQLVHPYQATHQVHYAADGEWEGRFAAFKQDTKRLFDSMRQILQGTNLQLQNNSRDIERLEQQLETSRNLNMNKTETDIDFNKKLLGIERDHTQMSKQHSQDLFEVRQS
jgi:hypothetical protein